MLAITDCDHASMEQEEIVFSSHGIRPALLDCHSEDELISGLQNCAIAGAQYAPFTRRVFSKLPDLRAIVRYGVGVDNIDLEAASEYGVAVSNVPDYGVQEVASHALAFMMALERKLPAVTKSVREGKWSYDIAIPITRLTEQTLGIIGFGRIGKCFAKIANCLGMSVIFCDIEQIPLNGEYSFAKQVSFEELLRSADVVSLHCNLETSLNLIDRQALSQMKKTAYLINVSRGGIIDESALSEALSQGLIAGAACDVVAPEPPVGVHPLLKFDNFILTPHMAWYSEQASKDLKTKLAEEMVRYHLNQAPKYRLN